jgi:hypothetical protein
MENNVTRNLLLYEKFIHFHFEATENFPILLLKLCAANKRKRANNKITQLLPRKNYSCIQLVTAFVIYCIFAPQLQVVDD